MFEARSVAVFGWQRVSTAFYGAITRRRLLFRHVSGVNAGCPGSMSVIGWASERPFFNDYEFVVALCSVWRHLASRMASQVASWGLDIAKLKKARHFPLPLGHVCFVHAPQVTARRIKCIPHACTLRTVRQLNPVLQHVPFRVYYNN